MNFVYVVGTGSHWRNNELRYSLRSLANVPGTHAVTVIGHAPAWLTGVDHIAMKDEGKDPVVNVTRKIWTALPFLPDEFILMNDDFFIMRRVDQIPTLHGGPMVERLKVLNGRRGPYVEPFTRSYRMLREAGIESPLNFGIHTPFPMERDKLKILLSQWSTGEGLLKTLYGNMFASPESRFSRDVKTNVWSGKSEFWSTPNHLLPVAQVTLQRRFPRRCAYEKA